MSPSPNLPGSTAFEPHPSWKLGPHIFVAGGMLPLLGPSWLAASASPPSSSAWQSLCPASTRKSSDSFTTSPFDASAAQFVQPPMMRGCGGRMGLFLNISLPPNASTANASTSPSEVSTFGHLQRSSGHVGVAEAHISAHHASSAIGEMLEQPWRGSPTWFCLRTACCLATGTAGGAIVDRSIMVPSAVGGEQSPLLSPSAAAYCGNQGCKSRTSLTPRRRPSCQIMYAPSTAP